jgi:hypothetical protein
MQLSLGRMRGALAPPLGTSASSMTRFPVDLGSMGRQAGAQGQEWFTRMRRRSLRCPHRASARRNALQRIAKRFFRQTSAPGGGGDRDSRRGQQRRAAHRSYRAATHIRSAQPGGGLRNTEATGCTVRRHLGHWWNVCGIINTGSLCRRMYVSYNSVETVFEIEWSRGSMDGPYVVYGSPGSGSVPVETALTLIGVPFEVVGETVMRDVARNPAVFEVNPLGQVPALVLPNGEVMTESAPDLARRSPSACRFVGISDRHERRPAVLRWMAYVSSAIMGSPGCEATPCGSSRMSARRTWC